MAKKGVKIKELARELHVTSRVLLDRCRAEGIHVQNSVTRLPPHMAPLVRSWFEVPAGGDKSTAGNRAASSGSDAGGDL